MKRIILISLICFFGYFVNAQNQFKSPVTRPLWQQQLKVDTLFWLNSTDTTTKSASSYEGALIYQKSDKTLYISNGSYYQPTGSNADLSEYLLKSDFSDSINSYIDTSKVLYLSDSTVKYVTPGQLRDSLSNYQTLDSLYLNGKWITEFSDDSTLGEGSDRVLPTQGAVKKYVQRILSQSNFVSVEKFGAIPDDDSSDAKGIQSTLNWVADNGGIVYFPPGRFDIDTTIIISSNTTIWADNGAAIFLMDSSNVAMLRNKGFTVPVNDEIVDSNITIIGGTWYGNGDNQKHPGAFTEQHPFGIEIASAKNIRLYDLRIVNTQMYSTDFINCKNIYIDHIDIRQFEGQPPVPGHNQDGIHIDGPGENIFITNSKIKASDDAIGINANHVYFPYFSGPINNVFISNVMMDSTLKGIRLLSGHDSVTNVLIEGITGTSIGNIIEISDFNLGPGKFGSIQINNINCNVNTSFNDCWCNKQRVPIRIGSNIESISLSNIYLHGNWLRSSTIEVFDIANIGTLKLDNINLNYRGSDSTIGIDLRGAQSISNLFINDYVFKANKNSVAVDFGSTQSNSITVKNAIILDTVKTAISSDQTDINTLTLSNNRGFSFNGVITDSSTIDSIYFWGNTFIDTAGLSINIDSASTFSKIFTTQVLSSDTYHDVTLNNLRYSDSNQVYQVNLDLATNKIYSTASLSGDGSTTEFTVSISPGFTPSNIIITPTTEDAAKAQLWVDKSTITSTQFTVKVAGTVPPSGTDNVTFDYVLIE